VKNKKELKHRFPVKNNPAKLSQTGMIVHWKYSGALLFILLLSFIVYLPVLQNGFVWDDEEYIQTNSMLHSFNLQEIFSSYVAGNYHPFTMLTLTIEYHIFGLNATGYHAVNLLLHLLNVILVFYSVILLSDKTGVALITALLFGIHPLHVESVAWAAELKDLLYTFFFLVSYIFYLKYLKEFKKNYLVFTLLFFSFSILSKAMAASLPAVLVLTDYFKGRKINLKTLLEKVPFILIAFALGLVAIVAQKSSEAILDTAIFSFPQRIAFACYGFITYLLKLLLPLNLSAFYPYPVKSGSDIPIQFYFHIVLFLGLLALFFLTLRFSKKIIFGIGFFVATVFLVLQLLPVGSAIMADRYSYIPSIGIFYLAGEGFNILWNKKFKWISLILLASFTLFFSVTTYSRCSIWSNSLTLWSDVINKYKTVPVAYFNRGIDLMKKENYDQALDDFNKAIELKTDNPSAYFNIGIIYMKKEKYFQALNNYNKAIQLKPAYSEAYINRGVVYMYEKKYNEALDDFNKATEINSMDRKGFSKSGSSYKNKKINTPASDKSMSFVAMKANYVQVYINRGNDYKNEKKYTEAISDYSKAIELRPDFAEVYYNRGVAFYNEKRYDEAISDYSKAIELKSAYPEAYFNRGLAEYHLEKKDAACKDFKQAESLGLNRASDLFRENCK